MNEATRRFLFRTPVLLAVILAVFLSGCAPATQEAAGPRDECGLIEPAAADVEYALSFGKQAFTSEDWVRSYTVEPYKITLTRSNNVVGAIAYLQYLMFNCGYGQEELDSYFSDQNFAITFADYESYTLADFCEKEGLALYEYDLVEESVPYQARYWVDQTSDTRLLVLMLVFPVDTPELMEEYSGKIFPQFTSCD